jgi:hypothetical protein
MKRKKRENERRKEEQPQLCKQPAIMLYLIRLACRSPLSCWNPNRHQSPLHPRNSEKRKNILHTPFCRNAPGFLQQTRQSQHNTPLIIPNHPYAS